MYLKIIMYLCLPANKGKTACKQTALQISSTEIKETITLKKFKNGSYLRDQKHGKAQINAEQLIKLLKL